MSVSAFDKATDTGSLLADLAGAVQERLDGYCDRYLRAAPRLAEAMRYSLNAGGKRLRPALVLISARACAGDADSAMVPACAIEMVHTFSLIHDDLPAMDDDDLRRGKPTNHKVFGQAMAILAGDGLMIFAFDLIARESDAPAPAMAMVRELADAAGPNGMTGGQALDIDYDAGNADPALSERVHMLKTAAMIRAAARLGAISAGADRATTDLLGQYGRDLGLAFQIVDDILDVSGDAASLGKQTNKDATAGKPNYAVLVGVDAARERAEALTSRAVDIARSLGDDAACLADLARYVAQRTH